MKAEITGNDIRAHIFSLRDSSYKEFHSKLVPGEESIIGVRVPVLRQYARRLCSQYGDDFRTLIGIIGNDYYEEIMLQGMIIGLQKKINSEELFDSIEAFVPKIKNWAVCDVFCAGLKQVRRYPQKTYEFLQRYLDSDEEYHIRFGLVMLLDYFVSEEYLHRIFSRVQDISHEGYYVKMAAAWLLSICLIKFYPQTLEFMKECRLDDFTYNKALQKARESLRITKEQKAQLQTMKRIKPKKEK